ncbi:zinc finger and BTB domain-containing protein 24-like [Chironomus tepperi]|uniref:zinc finger and BTB domain-containing protein 24-like n=1 Tax=Chironomus tepperi TaxID=113505 RepID=UPI00391F7E9E
MPQEVCKLCGQTNQTFGHTIRDKLITEFLLKAVVRLNNTEKNKNVCNICYAKAKIVVDFVTIVNRTQNNQPHTSSPSKSKFSTVQDSLSSSTNFVAIKQEHIDSPDIFYNEYGDDSNCYEDDNQSEPEVESKKKEKLKLPKIKQVTPKKFKRSEPQKNAFRCANCKQEHKSFKALEAHIADCFKAVEEFKCFVCDKVLETRKKLYSHMESHKVYNKRVRDRSGSAQKSAKKSEDPEPKTNKFKCKQCTASYNSLSDLTKHKRDIHIEGESNDSDMHQTLLEKARRLIEEIN